MANPFKKQAKSGGEGGDYEQAPAGNHPAVLVAIVDLGTHLESFGGQKAKSTQQVLFVWELTAEKDSTGKNFVIGMQFTNSLHAKAGLSKMLTSWRGQPLKDEEEFDFTVCLGKPALVGVVRDGGKDGDQYAKFVSCARLPKGMPAPVATYKPFTFIIDKGADLTKLPPWLPFIFGKSCPDKIKTSDEWIALSGNVAGKPGMNGGAPKQQQPQQQPVGAGVGHDHEPLGSDDEVPF